MAFVVYFPRVFVDEIKENVDTYARIFVFSVQNMRNTKLKDLRTEWKHSRFYFGKNKITALGLGRDAADEYKENLHKISRRLYGQMGLLFTNKSTEEVIKHFSQFIEPDFARSGASATQKIVINEGPLTSFSHSLEPHLRKLGLPTCLVRGVVTLRSDYTVCETDQTLTPEQAQILKLFGHKMADFHVTIDSVWQNDGTFKILRESQPDSPAKDARSIRLRPKDKSVKLDPEDAYEAVMDEDANSNESESDDNMSD